MWPLGVREKSAMSLTELLAILRMAASGLKYTCLKSIKILLPVVRETEYWSEWEA